MKRLLLAIALISVGLQLSAKDIVAYFDYKTFYSPDEGSILETYLNFDGSSVNYSALENGMMQAKIEVVVVVTKGASEIVGYSKKEVTSPEIIELNYVNFLDQNRFLVKDGDYNLDIKIKDLNDPSGANSSFKKNLRLSSESKRPFFSDIQLLAGYRQAADDSPLAKSGYDLLPYLSNFYPADFSEMMFYVEAYNLDKKIGAEKPMLLSYYIEDPSSKTVVNNMRKFHKMNSSSVVSHIGSFKLDNLYSGTYNLIVEVRDTENNLLSQTQSKIIRNKTNVNVSLNEEEINNTFVGYISNRDSLEYLTLSLRPISKSDDIEFITNVQEFDILKLKSFFYSFWYSRNSDDPKADWEEYYKNVLIAEDLFGNNLRHGFETDMGRVFLKYGKPTSIHAELSPSNMRAFQIWHYNETDSKFVFYSPSAVQAEFVLLHTNRIDEIRNPNRWVEEIFTYRGGSNFEDLDQKRNNNYLKELFNNPRHNFSLFE